MTKYILRIEHGDIESDKDNQILESIRRTFWGLMSHEEITNAVSRGTNDCTEWSFNAPDPGTLEGLTHVAKSLAPQGWVITSVADPWTGD